MRFLEALTSRRILEIPNLRMGRRKLFQVAAAIGGTAATVSIGLHTPDTSSPQTALAATDGYEIFPGWIERNGSTPFIQLDNGHFHWMREKISNNPILFELTRDFLKCLLDHAQKGEGLKLGDALAYNILQARDKIQRIDSSHIDPNANLHLENVRTALFPLAAGFTGQWWSGEDLGKFGISLEQYGYKDIDDFHWGPRGIGTVAYPKLFGVDKEEPKDSPTNKIKYGGQDRTIHLAHHGLVVFELLYSRMYGLPIHESMPQVFKILLAPGSNGSPYESARNFSETTGWLYELSGLKNTNNWPINGRTPQIISEGIFDDMVEADLKGNRLGAEVAIALFDRARRRQPIDDIIAQLNNPRYADFETPPTLNLPR